MPQALEQGFSCSPCKGPRKVVAKICSVAHEGPHKRAGGYFLKELNKASETILKYFTSTTEIKSVKSREECF